jgi:predicted SAM-dependent methyltransferase
MKLHLGCYQKKIYGFTNIDIREDVNPDIVDDVFKLEKIKDNSVELIYVCHVLEHATIEEAKSAIKRWYQILKSGGVLRIAVPDLEAVFEHYIFHKDLKILNSFIYGSQKHDYDYHRCGWDEKTLTEFLKSVGFDSICRYDWRETEHFYIDDYSQCYLPEMSYKSRRLNDEIKGKLMSLNIEAIK